MRPGAPTPGFPSRIAGRNGASLIKGAARVIFPRMGRSVAPTAKQVRFAELMISGSLSASEAYRLAYPGTKATPKTVNECASKLSKNPKVAAIIAQGRAISLEKAALTQADIVRAWSEAATVDRNELVEVRRGACRYCFGRDHKYQERPSEREARYRDYLVLVTNTKGAWPEFDELGGLGFDTRRDPHPDCPECDGLGEERVIIKDTRKLSPAARNLYEGVDIKSGSIVIQLRKRETAEEKLAKVLGVLKDGSTPAAPINNNILIQNNMPSDPVEASKVYQRLIQG